MERLGKRHKQLLDDVNEHTGYWKLEEAALDGILWRAWFGTGCGPVIRKTTEKTITNLANLSLLILIIFLPLCAFSFPTICQSTVSSRVSYKFLLNLLYSTF